MGWQSILNPTLLSVNREPRTEILKVYDQPFIKEVNEATPLVYGTISIVKDLYFNHVYDTVYINVVWVSILQCNLDQPARIGARMGRTTVQNLHAGITSSPDDTPKPWK